MKVSTALIVLIAIGVAAFVARSIRIWPSRKHDPIEYYRSWGGYTHPIALGERITKEETEAIAARGNAYLIGYFDDTGKLVRVVKMLRGAVFFDFEYAYHANGKRKSAKVTNAEGRVTFRDYDERGRDLPGNPTFW
jgi:hypothetical protein